VSSLAKPSEEEEREFLALIPLIIITAKAVLAFVLGLVTSLQINFVFG